MDQPRSRYPYSADGRIAVPAVADWLDPLLGFNLPVKAATERVAALAEQCKRRGRSLRELTVAVALADGSPGVLPELAAVGVTEFVVVAAPPAQPAAATTWVEELAAQWGRHTRAVAPTV